MSGDANKQRLVLRTHNDLQGNLRTENSICRAPSHKTDINHEEMPCSLNIKLLQPFCQFSGSLRKRLNGSPIVAECALHQNVGVVHLHPIQPASNSNRES